jgi:hypothetical protein
MSQEEPKRRNWTRITIQIVIGIVVLFIVAIGLFFGTCFLMTRGMR